jgi:hypothetical protein
LRTARSRKPEARPALWRAQAFFPCGSCASSFRESKFSQKRKAVSEQEDTETGSPVPVARISPGPGQPSNDGQSWMAEQQIGASLVERTTPFPRNFVIPAVSTTRLPIHSWTEASLPGLPQPTATGLGSTLPLGQSSHLAHARIFSIVQGHNRFVGRVASRTESHSQTTRTQAQFF